MSNMHFLITVVSFFYFGWWARGLLMKSRFSEDPDHFINILQKIKEINELEQLELKKEGTELSIERVGNTLYAYVKDTGQFIAQGPSLEELLNSAQDRFPDRKFFGKIDKDNPAKELA